MPKLANTLVIISCGKAKIWDRSPGIGAVPARDAYVSSLFKVSLSYAEHIGGAWAILSAKYGFLDPNEPILQYNVAFGKSSDAITVGELQRQWHSRFGHVRRVISLASKAYDLRLVQAIGQNVKFRALLEGKNLFERMRWLKEARQS